MESSVNKLLLVGIGGFVGSIARYWVQGDTYKVSGPGFPYGTLAVNIVGCFLIGIVIVLTEERFLIIPEIRILLAVCVLGGFTTFSSFSYETIALIGGAEYFDA